LMELDRYYPTAGVAVEYNGNQHYEETDLATFEETVKQVGRDAMKAFICKARGIELAIIHPEDLKLKSIDHKIPERVPTAHLKCESWAEKYHPAVNKRCGPLPAALHNRARVREGSQGHRVSGCMLMRYYTFCQPESPVEILSTGDFI
jgi:hypothetical protein